MILKSKSQFMIFLNYRKTSAQWLAEINDCISYSWNKGTSHVPEKNWRTAHNTSAPPSLNPRRCAAFQQTRCSAPQKQTPTRAWTWQASWTETNENVLWIKRRVPPNLLYLLTLIPVWISFLCGVQKQILRCSHIYISMLKFSR